MKRVAAAVALFLGLMTALSSRPAGAVVGTLTPSPTTVNLGSVRLGGQAVDVLTLTNSSGSPIVMGGASNQGGNTDDFFGVTGVDPDTQTADLADDCLSDGAGGPRVMADGDTCKFLIFGYPLEAGTRTTTLTVTDDSGNTVAGVTLTMVGTEGYYVARASGSVAKFGDAVLHGDAAGTPLNGPILDIQQVPFGEGYWLLGSDGGVFSYGPDATFHGSTGGMKLNRPVVSMAAVDPDGYYTVATDGGVFAFNKPFEGSMGGSHLNQPVVGMAYDQPHGGYWLVASDGGVFTFGTEEGHTFHGGMAGQHLNAPIIGIQGSPTGNGYWLFAADGGVFNFGDAAFAGAGNLTPGGSPIVDFASTPPNAGYWQLRVDGTVIPRGDAQSLGSSTGEANAMGITGTGTPIDFSGVGGGYTSINAPAGSASAMSRVSANHVFSAAKAFKAAGSRVAKISAKG
jgi:hypothetical protein